MIDPCDENFLKDATRLKRAGNISAAIELLKPRLGGDDCWQFGVETCFKLTSYLVLAGRRDEAWLELQRLLRIYIHIANPSGAMCAARVCGRMGKHLREQHDVEKAEVCERAVLALEFFGQRWMNCFNVALSPHVVKQCRRVSRRLCKEFPAVQEAIEIWCNLALITDCTGTAIGSST